MLKYITVNLQWSRQYSIRENTDKKQGCLIESPEIDTKVYSQSILAGI